MSEEILVEKKTEQDGKNDNGPWKRTAIKDAEGNWYSTFDTTAGEKLVEGRRYRIEYTSKPVNGRVQKNLVSVEPVDNGSLPEQYSHTTPNGDADWDKVALGKTRCALWKSFLEGHLASSLYAKAVSENAKQDGSGGRDPMDYVIVTGTRLVVHAERDTFERVPGDDGIPFDGDRD